MRRSSNKAVVGGVVLALVAGAAIAQERPESILPPGFNETTPPPPVDRAPPRAQPNPTAPGPTPLTPPLSPDESAELTDNSLADETAGTPAPVDPAALASYELPSYARRSLDRVGIIGAADGGLPANGFGTTQGRFLEVLMGRLNAPLPSRWLSIALRRTLASQLDTPVGVNGADFAAERAWLLVRMGESQVARAVVQAVDPDNFTPKLREAAMQTALATGDPGLVCPVTDGALAGPQDRAWVLMAAICAGLSGVAGEGGRQIDAARKQGVARGIDLLLADKVVGTSSKRRAVTIEWDSVSQLTAWRYGLATATATEIPEPLFATVAPRVQFWRAQAPMLDARARAGAAELAAAQGVLSSTALIDLFGEIDEAEEGSSAEAGVARDLRSAYSENDRAQRIAAMTRLWDEPRGPRGQYARLVLTSQAVGALPPASDAEADRLIASMLSAGIEGRAARWRSLVSTGGDGWAMLTLADRFGGTLGRGDVRRYGGGARGDTQRKRQMFFAALAGLGRVDPSAMESLAGDLGVDLTRDNSWTRAIDRAAGRGEPATVVLLAAVGMQTANWHGVSADALYRIIAAFHRVGLDAEARMIAVEALTRL
ncbi:MAG: hypothetical protein K2W81_07755 [Sphingomonas sp.]|uniref:hypothetical protein n=1 Tax=Sphingomonas sp. TaxID=28214 RepID=UPI0025F356DF|nr:hypothetical protein [Sphingomonas sp.]MBY0283844.1 hypothetical protein [Sphingomonas sp.]